KMFKSYIFSLVCDSVLLFFFSCTGVLLWQGGLFSIDKSYFYELGAYDPGLDVWGGENMEISFNIWMCGGEIEIIPCSRVGHIFRGDNPYNFPKNRVKTVERNLARVLFYGHGYHHLLDKTEIGNLTEQIELRKKLKCKSFKWYLENVYPDLDAPLVKAEGLNTSCLAPKEKQIIMEPCDITKPHLRWMHKSKGLVSTAQNLIYRDSTIDRSKYH
uniref:Uncharacterized protein n=1 Tax=Cyprinus carpio TaxID=7962 RepID=A0A8C2G8S6_CYPCA